jgi:hypothetical protein
MLDPPAVATPSRAVEVSPAAAAKLPPGRLLRAKFNACRRQEERKKVKEMRKKNATARESKQKKTSEGARAWQLPLSLLLSVRVGGLSLDAGNDAQCRTAVASATTRTSRRLTAHRLAALEDVATLAVECVHLLVQSLNLRSGRHKRGRDGDGPVVVRRGQREERHHSINRAKRKTTTTTNHSSSQLHPSQPPFSQ